jgi:hypothetical protein
VHMVLLGDWLFSRIPADSEATHKNQWARL